MRNPAIHIKLSDFITVLGNVGIKDAENVAYRIFAQAVPYSVKSRYIIAGDAKVRHKATKAIAVARNGTISAETFNRILTSQRIEIGHRHITPIRRGSKDYTTLQEIAKMACEFCANCGFESIDEGCKAYIHLGLEKMRYSSQYALGKFKYYDADIYKAYESFEMINTDPKPKRTRNFYNCYVALLREYADIERELKKPEDYVCFVYARLEADRVGAEIEDWLRAQFEELGRIANVVPSPNQLFSDNALKRYYTYFKSSATGSKQQQQEDAVILDWDEPKSDFEKKYAERLREKYGEQ